MTMKVLVGSQTLGTLMEVEGNGFTPIDARRSAVTIARSLFHIPDPVALTDNHRSAVIVRAAAEQKRQKLIDSIRASLSRNGSPLSQRRENMRYRS